MNDSNDKSVSSTHFSIDIEQLLAEGKTIKIKPQVFSSLVWRNGRRVRKF